MPINSYWLLIGWLIGLIAVSRAGCGNRCAYCFHIIVFELMRIGQCLNSNMKTVKIYETIQSNPHLVNSMLFFFLHLGRFLISFSNFLFVLLDNKPKPTQSYRTAGFMRPRNITACSWVVLLWCTHAFCLTNYNLQHSRQMFKKRKRRGVI